MFVEPDGSFLWTNQAMPRWQLEGTIYDDGSVVRYIELRGHCPLPAWQSFLSAFDESLATVTLELLDQNLIVLGDWLKTHNVGEG